MARKPDPDPKTGILNPGTNSPTMFMREELVYDLDSDSFVRFWSAFEQPDWTGVEDNEDDYVIEESWARTDQIAFKFYDDPRLKWVIEARNGLDLADVQLYRGRQIKIPRKEWVKSKLLTQARLIK